MRALLFAAALVGIGCSGSPLAPTSAGGPPALALARVTVFTTLGTIAGAALPGVTVRVNGRDVGVTDAGGRAMFDVAANTELTISVTHPRYRPFIPSATSTFIEGSHEKWFFAFEP